MSTYLITGASRGLGLTFATQLSHRSEVTKVIAATRNKSSKDLEALIASSNGKVINVILDVASGPSVTAAVPTISAALDGQGLDVLINNVGLQAAVEGGIENMPEDSLAEIFNTNVISAHRVTAALMPLLRNGKAKKVVNISTTLGSMAWAKEFKLAPQPQYKITKAALNMLTVQYALEYEAEGFTFVALSPGWLKTTLGGSEDNAKWADLEIDVGAKAAIEQILAAGPEQSGSFLNVHVPGWENRDAAHRYDGKSLPW